MSRRQHLRAVLRQLASDGTVSLWDFLLAFQTACDVLGGKLPGPLGVKGYQERVVGMCLAAACDVPPEGRSP